MKIHFIGIGGIGISGLAQYMHFNGHTVTGSDISNTIITKNLRDLGIEVSTPHTASSIQNQDLIIHSAVIKDTNPEIIEAKRQQIKIVPRRDAIFEILKDRKVYSVAGAHGKSTTTAIISAIMNGSAIIGAESKAFKSNVRYDDTTDVMLFEADESDASFLNSNPYCAIVINAEPEHMEYYNYDEEKFYDSYKQFILSAKVRVLNAEDPYLSTLIETIEAIWLYPSKDISDIRYKLIENQPYTEFSFKDLGRFSVWGFGEHIALDASLAILSAQQSMDIEDIRKNLLTFKGIKKRFDVVGSDKNVIIIDDYGHHPTEIKATFQSVKEYAKLKDFKTITTIWQPHKYSRTLDNLQAFRECFEGTDELIVLPVWEAGEDYQDIDFKEKFKHYNLTLANNIKRADNSIDIIKNDKVIKNIKTGLIISFGAGDITYQIRGEK